MEKIRPTNITADRNKRELIIEWNDGKECRYPFAGLRAVCPCAECQGGHDNMGRPADKDLLRTAENPELNMDKVEPVGTYAITILWSDGHWQGIYTWQYLHDACL
ncbi:MAG: DUF971 domain-containing protein [Anaerolineaceae bacterium]|nr:MAG: DUF971 domain-containing protein [Anaerolineaceae bacterium]